MQFHPDYDPKNLLKGYVDFKYVFQKRIDDLSTSFNEKYGDDPKKASLSPVELKNGFNKMIAAINDYLTAHPTRKHKEYSKFTRSQNAPQAKKPKTRKPAPTKKKPKNQQAM